MKVLYFDCFSGISGDMTIGALIDAGGDPDHLKKELQKLHLAGEYELTWNKVVKNGITSTKFDVLLTDREGAEKDHSEHHSHTDSPSHSHTHTHTHTHEGSHHHSHSYTHEHTNHSHEHTHHNHDHRAYRDIKRLIESADLTKEVKKTALAIFKKIGEAEGHIHGMPLEEVHFHEVGAVDSIIDIVGTAILLDQMDIDIVKSSPIPVGSGKIEIDHGTYPVPAPATLEILRGVPLQESEVKAELTTPTGAAIIAVLAEGYGPLPSMEIANIGYGAGTKTFQKHPNVLRAVIGKK